MGDNERRHLHKRQTCRHNCLPNTVPMRSNVFCWEKTEWMKCMCAFMLPACPLMPVVRAVSPSIVVIANNNTQCIGLTSAAAHSPNVWRQLFLFGLITTIIQQAVQFIYSQKLSLLQQQTSALLPHLLIAFHSVMFTWQQSSVCVAYALITILKLVQTGDLIIHHVPIEWRDARKKSLS